MLMIRIMVWVVWILTILTGIYSLYFLGTALFFFKRLPKTPQHEPKHRFAAIIAARNEQDVIANLVESLQMQNYPSELLDIIVVPNNCTDRTKEVAEEAGATVIECPHKVRSKGEVLTFVFDYLFEQNDVYDAFCIFDADNLVHPDFMRSMNNVLCEGSRVAQGYRDSKNPGDTFISACYSIYYWGVNRFYNHARSALGMSAMVNGSGFMVAADVIKEAGGWHSVTMTEDIEFTAQCACRGEKIAWAEDAIIYDEQPLTFLQSWKQRKRWSTGVLQGLYTYSARLIGSGVRDRNICCLDMVMFYTSPIMQILSFVVIALAMWLNLTYLVFYLFPFPQLGLYQQLFIGLNLSYIAVVVVALLTVGLAHKSLSRVTKGVLTFWIFLLSWVPINIICLFKRQQNWEEIRHTSQVKITEVTENSPKRGK